MKMLETKIKLGTDLLGRRKPGRLKLSTGIAECVLRESLMCGGQTGEREGGGQTNGLGRRQMEANMAIFGHH